MKLLIAGSRDYPTNGNFNDKMNELVKLFGVPSEVVSGHCKTGPDKLGEDWAKQNNIPVKLFPADWDKFGRSAGPIRNKHMAEYCDRAIVFWDGQSRGSQNMINELKRFNKAYHVIYPHS
jgi:hypothetical protein